jgi:hypothetical protein
VTLYNSLSSNKPMTVQHWPICPVSDLQTRQIKWISRHDQTARGTFPSSYIPWGVSAVSLAAQFAETYADSVKTPTFE